MDVTAKAKELGLLIADSEQMKKFRDAEAILFSDEVGMNLFNNLNKLQQEFASAMHGGDEAKADQYKKEFTELNEEVKNNEIAMNYVDSKNAVDELLKQVNDIVMYTLTGEEKCDSGGCSSCGCGCK